MDFAIGPVILPVLWGVTGWVRNNWDDRVEMGGAGEQGAACADGGDVGETEVY